MQSIEFRYATPTDAAMLANLTANTFWDAYERDSNLERKYIRDYMSTAFSIEQITLELAEEKTIYLVAESNSEEIGYSKLLSGSSRPEISGNRNIEISRIYLIKEFWGKNFGAPLLNRCVDEARIKEFDIIWLSVWEHNLRAIRFYEKHGFSKVGKHMFDLASSPQTDFVMERKVE